MVVVLGSREVHHAAAEAALPPGLRTAPFGFGWASSLVPASRGAASFLGGLLVLGACAALVGLLTRLSLLLTTVLLGVLLAVPQQWGQGVHTHHLLWFSALLAAGPSGDALSLDAWLRRRRGVPVPPASVAHGVPIRAAWVVIGLIYLFPGLWKLHAQGLDWAFSSNLLHQLHWKWLEFGRTPLLRLDRWPQLLKVGGLAVLALEVGFLPLVMLSRTRPFAVGAALGFHLLARVFFFIDFSSLWACFTVFVPWSRWCDGEPPSTEQGRSAVPALLVAAMVIGGQVATGVLGIEHGWPFACYPTFQHDPGPRVPLLVMEEERPDGTRVEMPRPFLTDAPGQREWGAMWSVLREPSPGRLLGWWRMHREPRDGRPSTVRFFHATAAAEPERWAEPARREKLLATLPGDGL